RAALPRGSSFGLLSVRTTFCSNFDGWPYGGGGDRGARLHGPFWRGPGGADGGPGAAALVSRRTEDRSPRRKGRGEHQALGGTAWEDARCGPREAGDCS